MIYETCYSGDMEWDKVGTRKPGTFVAYTVDDIPWLADRSKLPPAAEWLDGHVHCLIPGTDFDNLANLRSKLWNLADRMQRRVRTRMVDGVLFVQAIDQDGNPRPDARIIQPRDVAEPQVPQPAAEPSGSPQGQPQWPAPGQVEV